MNAKEMVEKFICPGCVCGSDINCGKYKEFRSNYGHGCEGHVVGTLSLGTGSFALGLPRGFNRAGYRGQGNKPDDRNNTMMIRLWPEGSKPEWDKFNIPVWAMEQDGFLFVRTYQPRINFTCVDVVEKGTLSLVEGSIDVGKFYDEMD